jgi:hypothetical protein
MLDLKGVSPLLRDNTATVPAASNTEALLALCAREVKQLETRLVLILEGRDKVARGKTRLGLLPPVDAATRKYKSDEARAHKRFVWAFENFKLGRMGLPPATLIDPATGRPLPEAEADAAASGGSGATTTPGPAPARAPEPAQGRDPEPQKAWPFDEPILTPPPIPEGISPEDYEMMMVVGATLRGMAKQGLLKHPGSAPPT